MSDARCAREQAIACAICRCITYERKKSDLWIVHAVPRGAHPLGSAK